MRYLLERAPGRLFIEPFEALVWDIYWNVPREDHLFNHLKHLYGIFTPGRSFIESFEALVWDIYPGTIIY